VTAADGLLHLRWLLHHSLQCRQLLARADCLLRMLPQVRLFV